MSPVFLNEESANAWNHWKCVLTCGLSRAIRRNMCQTIIGKSIINYVNFTSTDMYQLLSPGLVKKYGKHLFGLWYECYHYTAIPVNTHTCIAIILWTNTVWWIVLTCGNSVLVLTTLRYVARWYKCYVWALTVRWAERVLCCRYISAYIKLFVARNTVNTNPHEWKH